MCDFLRDLNCSLFVCLPSFMMEYFFLCSLILDCGLMLGKALCVGILCSLCWRCFSWDHLFFKFHQVSQNITNLKSPFILICWILYSRITQAEYFWVPISDLWSVILRMRNKQTSQYSVNTQVSFLPCIFRCKSFHWDESTAGNSAANFILFAWSQGLVSWSK